jgi:prepilin-type N-terminal cleavage/methylation domain-containing protein
VEKANTCCIAEVVFLIRTQNIIVKRAVLFGRAQLFSHFQMKRAFTMIEVLIAMAIGVMVLSAVYLFFSSSSQQTSTGTKKLEIYHRLRMVTEVLKDDLREAYEFKNKSGIWEPTLEFVKFGGLTGEAGREVTPKLKQVRYKFDPDEKRLTGTYGSQGNLFDTQLFEEVAFQLYYIMGRPFVRMKFVLTNMDEKNPERGKVVIYHTVGSRHLNSYVSQKYWYSLSETRGVLEDPISKE